MKRQKLQLAKETIRQLNTSSLAAVGGGSVQYSAAQNCRIGTASAGCRIGPASQIGLCGFTPVLSTSEIGP
jgi:hypothetical protein